MDWQRIKKSIKMQNYCSGFVFFLCGILKSNRKAGIVGDKMAVPSDSCDYWNMGRERRR